MTAVEFIPHNYQHKMIWHIIENKRGALFAGMGMGKTSSALTAFDILQICGIETKPALVIAPLRVAKNVWPNEAKKWKHLEKMRIVPILGTATDRAIALRKPADVFTINYENLPWLLDFLNGEWPFGMVFADESTKLKGFRLRQGTSRAKALARVAHAKVTRFINLTGTPAPNGLVDLWGQTWFLDAGVRLGRTFSAFTDRWFRKSFDGYSISPMPHAQAEIEGKLRDICLSLRAKDYFDLRDPIVRIIDIELPKEARQKYTDMEKEMFMRLGESDIEAFNAASRTMKCLQLANGAAYVDKDATEWQEVHKEKLHALEEIIEEAGGMPVLVAYHFKSDLARLQKHFPQGRVLDKSQKTEDDWNAGKIPVLFAHPQSAGHGLNLQHGGNILVFFSVNWNLEEHDQISERIGPTRQLQSGLDRPVYVYYILAKDTVDYDVRARLVDKRDTQDILLDAMRRFEKSA